MQECDGSPEERRFTEDRFAMVRDQIAARGVTDERVLDALRAVPRHYFVSPDLRHRAYEDHPMQIGQGQTISQPYIVGLMTQLLELEPGDRVLEVGAGSGYQAAILATLAAEVFTIERNEALFEQVRDRLEDLGYGNITAIHGDGTLGCPEHAPFDAIVVTAAGPHVPESLKTQLAPGGRLVCPAGPRERQQLIKYVRDREGLRYERSIDCVFVPLIGREGWAEE